MNAPEIPGTGSPVQLKSFKQFLEDAGMGGGTGAVAANVTGNSANMAMPPDMNGKKLLKRQAKNPELK
jgi:hypothetical protein